MLTILNSHSHFSLLSAISKPSDIAKKIKELGYDSCAITDYGSISGCISFSKEMKKLGLKPILGSELYILKNGKTYLQPVISKNLAGWQELIQITSRSNDDDLFDKIPKIDFQNINNICRGNLISFSGHKNSCLESVINEASSSEKINLGKNFIYEMFDVFGKDNFYLAIQAITNGNDRLTLENLDIIRNLSALTGAKCIAVGNPHYTNQEDSKDHNILICSGLGTNIREIKTKQKSGVVHDYDKFFLSDLFYIPNKEDLLLFGNTELEIENTLEINAKCENYEILRSPSLPKFDCPDGMTEQDYLRHLCIQGWNKRFSNWDKELYASRVKNELSVLNGANLAGYFLIFQDFVNYAKSQGWLVGPGRGSAAGCLISYLLGITCVDPIKYGLIFERFYNAGRNTKDNISMPDIDVDFPIEVREHVVKYITKKYGEDKVCKIATFGRMQGRAAIREVLRINEVCSFEEINKISKNLPQEHEIIDELKETNEHSIIRWSLKNEPKLLSEWCEINDDGNLVGDYSQYFAQAIRLEGTYKTQGKHAAGIVISPEPLSNICPMIRDKEEGKIVGLDKDDAELIGLLKMDLLGVAGLSKLQAVNSLLSKGQI